jgi:hypothetical protein
MNHLAVFFLLFSNVRPAQEAVSCVLIENPANFVENFCK